MREQFYKRNDRRSLLCRPKKDTDTLSQAFLPAKTMNIAVPEAKLPKY